MQPDQTALLVSPQYTVEEFDGLLQYFVKEHGVKKVFQWREPTEKRDEFDNLLLRGDRNANTIGLQKVMEKYGLTPEVRSNGFKECMESGAKLIVALAPEVDKGYPSLPEQLDLLSKAEAVSLWTTHSAYTQNYVFANVIPMKGFAEKQGHFLNYQGKEGKLAQPFPALNDQVRDVVEAITMIKNSK